MAYRFPAKDPADVKDYKVRCADWLAGDTIATATWTMPAGLTKDSQQLSDTNTSAVIWISGGTAGQDYSITLTIVTAGGRTLQVTIKIKVKEF